MEWFNLAVSKLNNGVVMHSVFSGYVREISLLRIPLPVMEVMLMALSCSLLKPITAASRIRARHVLCCAVVRDSMYCSEGSCWMTASLSPKAGYTVNNVCIGNDFPGKWFDVQMHQLSPKRHAPAGRETSAETGIKQSASHQCLLNVIAPPARQISMEAFV